MGYWDYPIRNTMNVASNFFFLYSSFSLCKMLIAETQNKIQSKFDLWISDPGTYCTFRPLSDLWSQKKLKLPLHRCAHRHTHDT